MTEAQAVFMFGIIIGGMLGVCCSVVVYGIRELNR